MSTGITIRKCHELKEFHRCVDLQRQIWGEADLEVEPATMFVVAAHTGGQVLCAFDGDLLVGYTLAVAAARNAAVYLHSHMTGVHRDYQDRGVGRKLKLYQREEALSRGIRLIEWTFDPLEVRNAHFNLNRLGAISRQYLPNLYGVTTSPLHRGLPTDRLLAEWHLDSPRVVAALADLAKDPAEAAAIIDIPDFPGGVQDETAAQVVAVQTHVREQFNTFFARGYAAIALRKKSSGHAYVLAPWSDF